MSGRRRRPLSLFDAQLNAHNGICFQTCTGATCNPDGIRRECHDGGRCFLLMRENHLHDQRHTATWDQGLNCAAKQAVEILFLNKNCTFYVNLRRSAMEAVKLKASNT